MHLFPVNFDRFEIVLNQWLGVLLRYMALLAEITLSHDVGLNNSVTIREMCLVDFGRTGSTEFSSISVAPRNDSISSAALAAVITKSKDVINTQIPDPLMTGSPLRNAKWVCAFV